MANDGSPIRPVACLSPSGLSAPPVGLGFRTDEVKHIVSIEE
jgi:hypothetical protein